MTFAVGALFSAVESNNYRMLWTMMHAMTMDENGEGRHRCRSTGAFRTNRSDLSGNHGSRRNLPFCAGGVFRHGEPRSSHSRATAQRRLRQDVSSGVSWRSDNQNSPVIATVHNQRAASPQIVLYRDDAYAAPPNFRPALLTEANFR